LKPDLVVVDTDIPQDGIEATRQPRKAAPECHVILKCTDGDEDAMADAYATGASAYLVKGFSPSSL